MSFVLLLFHTLPALLINIITVFLCSCRCDLKVVVGQVPTDGATDSLTYLSGGTDDFPEAFKPDDDSLHSDVSIKPSFLIDC